MVISFLIHGLLVSFAFTADERTTNGRFTTAKFASNENISTSITNVTATDISIMRTTSGMNVTADATPRRADNETSTSGKPVPPMIPSTTPKPRVVSKVTKTATTRGIKPKSTTVQPVTSENNNTGIVIIVVIIVVAVGFAIACYVARKKGRRYSVDFTSRPDETNIPLSAVEPETSPDTLPYNGMQTSVSAEVFAEEEPEEKLGTEDKLKAEADKSAVDPSVESAAPPPPPPPPEEEDQPRVNVPEQEQSSPPPAPVEPGAEDKTDDEGAVSTKTSVESLKEANDNNSNNNADVSQKRGLKSNSILWEVPFHSPV